MKKMDFAVFLDAGHGGLDEKGQYHCLLDGKKYRHKQGTFHDGPMFYEGVFNRRITKEVESRLRGVGIPCFVVSHQWLDYTLKDRVTRANSISELYDRCVLISNHANASPAHNARGFEVYTTPGQTQADRLADILFEEVEERLDGTIRMRADLTDGDHDKEARFYMLRKSRMPAMLIEHLFFDHPGDAALLMDERVIDLFADAQFKAILKFGY